MTQGDLQKLLRQADPAAVLVSSRILERVIREDRGLPNLHWNIPHAKTYICDRQMLFRHAEQADLELESDQLLPDTVILIARPDQEEMSNLERKRLLLKYWRRLFHARVHIGIVSLHNDGNLDDQGLRERIEVIGRTEFEEVRGVLTQDLWLSTNASDQETYVEFAAVYLEMRYFAASLLTNYFPGIRDFGKVEALLARDIDAAALFASTRLQGAGDPVQPVDSRSDESQEVYWKLVRQAQSAALEDNLVEAAILRMRASRVAPAAQTLPTRQEAEKDISHLGKRLGDALQLTETETSDWTRHLTLLLDKADQGTRPMEARLLAELLKVCQDYEEEIYTLDLVEYLLSGGKRPIKRPLPSQRHVRISKHLRAALSKLGPVRLSDTDRNHLTRLMQQALSKTEESLRSRFRPVLVTALEDVGLRPSGPLQRASFEKMVDELLDRISEYGFLTFAELRDTISRNQLKLPDLADPEDFIRGDPLIRLDKRLTSLLDGVYRPSEFYVRWLERFTSLKFGTLLGRIVTKWITVPVVSAWLILFILGMMLSHAVSYKRHPEIYNVALVLMGPANHTKEATGDMAGHLVGSIASPEPFVGLTALGPYFAARQELAPVEEPSIYWHLGLVGALTLFLIGIMHSLLFRRKVVRAANLTWLGLRALFWTLPLRLVPLATLRWLMRSWGFQLLWWYVGKPVAICAVIWLVWPVVFHHWYSATAVYIAVVYLVTSRLGRAFSESVRDAFINFGVLIRSGLLPGLFRFIVRLFKQIVEAVEYLLFKVDEWLRFRSGDGRASMIVRTLAGVLWFPFSFFMRFYMVVLIEPMLNPVKFPLTSIAAKVMWPIIYTSGSNMAASRLLIDLYVPKFLAVPFVEVTIFLLPDAVAWLVWEMKENWNLYRANRGQVPRPAVFGSHGETVRGLLQPGFHSGTVPRLYARLRTAERAAMHSRNWDAVRALREEIEHVDAAVQTFISREMLLILRQSRAWNGQDVTAGHVFLSTNRIRVELEHLDHPAHPVEIEIEHHHGWLLAGVASNGWLEALPPEQLRVFAGCLAYLYQRSDVDLVREQIRAEVPGSRASIDLTEEALLIRPSPDAEPRRVRLVQDFRPLPPDMADSKLIFARTPLTWRAWDTAWRQDQAGEGFPSLPGVGDSLLRLPPRVAEPDTKLLRTTEPYISLDQHFPISVEAASADAQSGEASGSSE